MTTAHASSRVIGTIDPHFSAAEREIMGEIGILDAEGQILQLPACTPQVPRSAITNDKTLNEAYDYEIPSSFSRGLAVTWKAGQRILWISGTASIDDAGVTVYKGDLRAQTWRTFLNLTRLFASEGATWADVVRTSCYLRDIDRDYEEFNRVRTLFFQCMNLDPLPASTGIQAKLCRSDLLIEIEAIGLVLDESKP